MLPCHGATYNFSSGDSNNSQYVHNLLYISYGFVSMWWEYSFTAILTSVERKTKMRNTVKTWILCLKKYVVIGWISQPCLRQNLMNIFCQIPKHEDKNFRQESFPYLIYYLQFRRYHPGSTVLVWVECFSFPPTSVSHLNTLLWCDK